MPNHVTNILTITGDSEILDKLQEHVLGKYEPDEYNSEPFEKVFDFSKIIPVPDDIFQGDLSMEKQAETQGRNWYDWNRSNWGTKWNAYDHAPVERDDETLTFKFDTAWSPPTPVIDALAEQFPEVQIVHEFIDEGWGFAGSITYTDGEGTDEHSIECSEENEELMHFYCKMYGEYPDTELDEKEWE